jgi:hypothetical protein
MKFLIEAKQTENALFEVYNKLTFHILITAVQFGITQKCLNY